MKQLFEILKNLINMALVLMAVLIINVLSYVHLFDKLKKFNINSDFYKTVCNYLPDLNE